MTPFKLSILSPRGKCIDQAVEFVVAPGLEGELGVLAHHAPMIAALRYGVTRVTIGGNIQYVATGEGFIEVTRDEVVMLVDVAEKAVSLEDARKQLAEMKSAVQTQTVAR